ncbi:MAG: response regulator transcription factor [Candidatus Acidiferrum sp.]
MAPRATILIVDDSSVLRHSIRSCIEENSPWQVCGEAENGKIAVEKVMELHPDLVLLDLSMPVMNGLDAARRIASVSPHTVMVMFTMHKSSQLLKSAKSVGIKAVLCKSEGDLDHLIDSLRGYLNPNPQPAA